MNPTSTIHNAVMTGGVLLTMLVSGSQSFAAAQDTPVVEVIAAEPAQPIQVVEVAPARPAPPSVIAMVQQDAPKNDKAGHDHTVSNFVFHDDVEGAQEIRIEMREGKPVVWIDGKKIDSDRMRHRNNRLILLDEEGNELKSVRLWTQQDDEERARAMFEWQERLEVSGSGDASGQGFSFRVHEAPKVMLGVYMDEPGAALIRHLKLREDASTLITGVYEGLPADEAGLEQYDIIITVDGEEDASPESIRDVLGERQPGDQLELVVIHEGERRTVTVELEAYDRQRMASATMLGSVPARNRMQEILVAPNMEGDATWVPMAPKMDIDHERIERMIREEIRSAHQHSEQAEELKKRAEHLSKEAVHNALMLGNDRIESLGERMERLEQMLVRLQRQLEEKLADDDAQ